MTTMPVSLQERIPLPISGPAGSAPTAGAGLSFNDVVRVLKQRIFLVLFIWFAMSALTVAATWYLSKHYPRYKATSVILVESPALKTPMRFDQPLLNPDQLDRVVQDQIVRATSEGVLREALKSSDVMQTQWYAQEPDKDELLDDLKEDLGVYQLPKTNFFAVSLSTRLPEDAPRIVNTIIEKYIVELEATSKSSLQKEWAYYRDQTAAKMRQLRDRRNDKTQFISTQFRTPGVADNAENVVTVTYRALSEAVTRLEAEKLQFKAAFENLRGLSPDQIAVSPQMMQMIDQDPQVATLKNQLVNTEQQQRMLLKRFGPEHREVRQLKSMIDSLESALNEVQLAKEKVVLEYQMKSAETAYLNATQAEIQLRDRLASQEAMQADLDRKMAEYRGIEEDVKMLEEEYSQLNQFTGQLGLLGASESTSKVRQIGIAQKPRERHFPRWEINLPAGSVLGLLLGIGLALLLELVDTSLKTPRDLSRHVHIPILGTVPDVDDEEVQIEQVELASRTAPRSMVADAFRSIRTNLLLSAPAERQRTVLVASARPEEGRTTVAVNLALSLAQNGRRVLLVDANFYRPAIQQFFPNTSGGGLSNILIGQARLAELAVSTDLPNLDVLPSGPTPPNPTELLAGPYLKRLFLDAQDRYDQVIVDGPPVLLVSDGLVLAGVVDGVILVCRAKATSRGVALRGREQLERVNGRIFGAVLNAVQVARGGYFREQIRSYYEYQPEASLNAASAPALPEQTQADAAADDRRPEV